MTNREEVLSRLEEFRESYRGSLLAVFSTEAVAVGSAGDCDPELIDPWFAYMTPWFDTDGSAEAWPAMVSRYGGVARKLMSLPAERRMQLGYGARAIIIRDAIQYTHAAGVLAACERVASLCESRADVNNTSLVEARTAAEEMAARAPTWTAAAVARVAARAARAEAWAAEEAARAAIWAADEAAIATRTLASVWEAEETRVAAADRITTAIFDLIERSS
jgi:hypothetical protein